MTQPGTVQGMSSCGFECENAEIENEPMAQPRAGQTRAKIFLFLLLARKNTGIGIAGIAASFLLARLRIISCTRTIGGCLIHCRRRSK